MLGWLGKVLKGRTVVEKVIENSSLDQAARVYAEAIIQLLPTHEIAYQFILEELEAASQGNAVAKAFAANSGINASEYKGSLQNSRPEVDGAGGAQQMLIGLCAELRNTPKRMVEFRIKVDEQVMMRFKFGRYGELTDRGGLSAKMPLSSAAETATLRDRFEEIANTFYQLTRSGLEAIDYSLPRESARPMIEEVLGDLPHNMLTMRTEILASFAMERIAKNALQHEEIDAACMFATSIICTCHDMLQKGEMSDTEKFAATRMRPMAKQLIEANYQAVRSNRARFLIAAAMSAE